MPYLSRRHEWCSTEYPMTNATTTDALIAALRCASRHVLSERTNDVGRVMETISQTVCYMMPNVTSPDGELVVLTDRDAVRDFYAEERTFMEVIESTVVVDLTADWYTFLEAVSTTRQVATGTLHQNDVVVLFPVADDGIIGEILLARRLWTDVYAGLPAELPRPNAIGDNQSPRCQSQHAHDQFLDGLRTGDLDRAAEAFSPSAHVAVRDPTHAAIGMLHQTGPDAVGERCRLIVEAVADREVVLLNRVVGDWYVFAEWVVRGTAQPGRLPGFATGEGVEIRCASVFPVTEHAKLGGEQGYCVVSRMGR
jgi:hypothetical protein